MVAGGAGIQCPGTVFDRFFCSFVFVDLGALTIAKPRLPLGPVTNIKPPVEICFKIYLNLKTVGKSRENGGMNVKKSENVA